MLEVASGGAGDRWAKGYSSAPKSVMGTTGESTLSGAHRGHATDDSRERTALLKKRKATWERMSTIASVICGASLCAVLVHLLSPPPTGIASIFYFDIRVFGSLFLFTATLGAYTMLKANRVHQELQALRRKPKTTVH